MTARFYEGKEPCPGCGRTGELVARKSKNSLCYDCENTLRIGQAIVKERNLDKNYYRMDDLRIGYLTWYEIPIQEVDSALRELLCAFSQFDRNNAIDSPTTENVLTGGADAITSRDGFLLPTVTFEAAKRLCSVLKKVCLQLKNDRGNMRKELMEEVARAKNEIYNEGVLHGRNLLMQLNNGEVIPDDFVKPVNKY